MNKFLLALRSAQTIVQVVGIIVSAVIASVAASQLGGDPLVGLATGAAVNSSLTLFSPS